MLAREIKQNIYWVGAVDWDRRLFDALIPTPDGTSYNSYLIKGNEKVALIDTVNRRMLDMLVNNLNQSGVKNIDYVIANHAEPDHSGSLPQILTIYPGAKAVCSTKCKDMLIEMLKVPEEKIITVNDRETLSLGDKTLEFVYTPWVHWPETMATYLREDKILFPCDFFGSHLATSDLFVSDKASVYKPAKRYFAEIMMPFRTIIKKNMEKVKELEIDIIAPSHGPLHNEPSFIINAYQEWISDKVKNEVVIPYVSMHGSTRKMVNYFVDALITRGITVKRFDLTDSDLGDIAMSLVDCATVVVGSPTVLAGAHPAAVYATFLVNALRPKVKFVSVIGSYGWGGKMVEQLASLLTNVKPEILEPVVIKGTPKEKDFMALDKLADTILEKHKTIL